MYISSVIQSAHAHTCAIRSRSFSDMAAVAAADCGSRRSALLAASAKTEAANVDANGTIHKAHRKISCIRVRSSHENEAVTLQSSTHAPIEPPT